MNDNCNDCGFPLDSASHVFNVNCAASNAEDDQLLAEIHEIVDHMTINAAELAPRLAEMHEVQAEWMAFMKFQHMLRADPSSYIPAGMSDA